MALKCGDPQFKVRIPPKIDAWLERQARVNHRTKTAEVAFRLEQAMKANELGKTRQRLPRDESRPSPPVDDETRQEAA